VVETAVLRNGNAYNGMALSGAHQLDLTSFASLNAGVGFGVRQTMTGLMPGAIYNVSFALGAHGLRDAPPKQQRAWPVSRTMPRQICTRPSALRSFFPLRRPAGVCVESPF
jgi:hypothetical protein